MVVTFSISIIIMSNTSFDAFAALLVFVQDGQHVFYSQIRTGYWVDLTEFEPRTIVLMLKLRVLDGLENLIHELLQLENFLRELE